MVISNSVPPHLGSRNLFYSYGLNLERWGLSSSDILIISIYPVTLFLGSIYPITNSEESYFASKTNWLNVYFVKNAWFWTTLGFGWHFSRLRPELKSRALIRWLVASLWWIFITQWFFGAPLTDRLFVSTGGKCIIDNHNPAAESTPLIIKTSASCKKAGRWHGGWWDLSGHCFMLTHASLFLWYEVKPAFIQEGLRESPTKAISALLFLWWWMLLMTALYFHTWLEKLSGWLAGTTMWLLIYVVVPQYSSLLYVIGVPSI